VLFDARASELTSCTRPEDCTLRNGLACCETCGASLETLIAVNASMRLPQCDQAPPCPPCVATYPSGYGATCTGGRCAVVLK
jgi:hypothetical protein